MTEPSQTVPDEEVGVEWARLRTDGERYSLIRDYNGKRIYRFRLERAQPKSVIVKTWASDRGTFFERVKRSLIGQLNGCENEFRMMEHLSIHAPALGVPKPIARFVSSEVLGKRCEVAILEDLGECTSLVGYLHDCALAGEGAAIHRANEFIVRSVPELLYRAEVIDDDHSVTNMVHVPATGRFHRIDFEVAQKRAEVRDPERAIGLMLGRLLATHAFGVQPHVEYTSALAKGLRGALPELTQAAWDVAERTTREYLERQRATRGIDTRVDLSQTIGGSGMAAADRRTA